MGLEGEMDGKMEGKMVERCANEELMGPMNITLNPFAHSSAFTQIKMAALLPGHLCPVCCILIGSAC